jgi:hypothetical protein
MEEIRIRLQVDINRDEDIKNGGTQSECGRINW